MLYISLVGGAVSLTLFAKKEILLGRSANTNTQNISPKTTQNNFPIHISGVKKWSPIVSHKGGWTKPLRGMQWGRLLETNLFSKA